MINYYNKNKKSIYPFINRRAILPINNYIIKTKILNIYMAVLNHIIYVMIDKNNNMDWLIKVVVFNFN